MRHFILPLGFSLLLTWLPLLSFGQGFCPQPLTAAEFDVYLQAIKGESFSSTQMEVARQEGICLTSAQIKTVMEVFSFESNKLEFAKWAYPRCSDPRNYITLNSALTYSSSKSELNQYVRSQGAPPAQNPVPPQPNPVQPIQPTPSPSPRPKEQTNPNVKPPAPQMQVTIPQVGIDFSDEYKKAAEKMHSFFVMTFGGEEQIDTPEDFHKPDEDPATLPAKAPRVVITQPELSEENQFTARTTQKQIRVEGVIGSTVGIYEVMINDQEAILTPKGEFSGTVLLGMGENKISISAKDTKGQISRIGFKVLREGAAPPVDPPPVVKKEDPVPSPVPAPFVSEVDTDIPKLKNTNKDAIAVVIGNARYSKTKPVDFAENDARVMKKYLISVLGFREGNILYYENATLGDFNTVFGTKGNPRGRLFNTIKQGVSDVVIFYSGHGAPGLKSNKAYFVPVEADPNYMENGGYALDVLYENLKALPAKTITLFSDACFSGADVFSNISPMVIRAREPAKEGLKNTSLLNSCTGTEVSCWHVEEKHGLFTFHLLKAMKEYATTDANKDKQVSLEEIFKAVSDNNEGVPYYARRFHGLPQTPVLQGVRNRVLFRY